VSWFGYALPQRLNGPVCQSSAFLRGLVNARNRRGIPACVLTACPGNRACRCPLHPMPRFIRRHGGHSASPARPVAALL